MRAIVLVKQVPDIRVGAVATKPDGTIDRSSVAAITNPADLHALEAGLSLADEVCALSMGPKSAETSLRGAVALGADRGVLLCDRMFAGSDTWATANALSAAIEWLGGADLILAGTSALDGETGHVGPQVAQRLGLPMASGCEELTIEGDRLRARRVVEGGYETVTMRLPALVTIAETGYEPRYPTLRGRKKGAAAEVTTLTASDLGLTDTSVGLNASPTKVARMEAVALKASECTFVDDTFTLESLAARIVELLPDQTIATPALDVESPVLPRDRAFQGNPGVWVVCETGEDGSLTPLSAQILSGATVLARQLDDGVAALLIGSDLEAAASSASRFGADRVMTFDDDRLKSFRGTPETQIVSFAARQRQPSMMLFGASTSGRELAPRVAAALGTGIAADCTGLYIADWERRGKVYRRILHQVRPAMGGGVLATCLCPEARPQISTVRPGVFDATPSPRSEIREIIDYRLTSGDFDVEIIDREVRHSELSLADADVVVAGGAGCGRNNWSLVERLAESLSGRVAASRAAVEAGLAPRTAQVGQTGATVRPQLYIACGISGALQHVVGMQASRTIVAINRDPDAPIFHFAHFGVVGDVAETIPRLAEEIARRRSLSVASNT